MIFGTYRANPKAQCEGISIMSAPSEQGYAGENIWTMAWEGSLNPKSAAPSSPMCSKKTVKEVRMMADIALAQAASCSTPLTINNNPEVAFTSYLPLYAQLVEGEGTCPGSSCSSC